MKSWPVSNSLFSMPSFSIGYQLSLGKSLEIWRGGAWGHQDLVRGGTSMMYNRDASPQVGWGIPQLFGLPLMQTSWLVGEPCLQQQQQTLCGVDSKGAHPAQVGAHSTLYNAKGSIFQSSSLSKRTNLCHLEISRNPRRPPAPSWNFGNPTST